MTATSLSAVIPLQKALLLLIGICNLVACVTADYDQRLTTAEIKQSFANVRDEAEIKDARGTTAVNFWYADGRFINHWQNAKASGEVKGRWEARADKRCVKILSGLEGANDEWRCSPLFKRGQRYVSHNADGSVHALHTLTALDE